MRYFAKGATSGLLADASSDVLRQLAAGRSNAEIAGALFVSEATVKSHVARLLSKLQLNNRVQLALFTHRHGLGSEED